MLSDLRPLEKGNVLWFNLGKGIGIIRPDSADEEDVYFDLASLDEDLVGTILPNMHVEFLSKRTLVGMYAQIVKPIVG